MYDAVNVTSRKSSTQGFLHSMMDTSFIPYRSFERDRLYYIDQLNTVVLIEGAVQRPTPYIQVHVGPFQLCSPSHLSPILHHFRPLQIYCFHYAPDDHRSNVFFKITHTNRLKVAGDMFHDFYDE